MVRVISGALSLKPAGRIHLSVSESQIKVGSKGKEGKKLVLNKDSAVRYRLLHACLSAIHTDNLENRRRCDLQTGPNTSGCKQKKNGTQRQEQMSNDAPKIRMGLQTAAIW